MNESVGSLCLKSWDKSTECQIHVVKVKLEDAPYPTMYLDWGRPSATTAEPLRIPGDTATTPEGRRTDSAVSQRTRDVSSRSASARGDNDGGSTGVPTTTFRQGSVLSGLQINEEQF